MKKGWKIAWGIIGGIAVAFTIVTFVFVGWEVVHSKMWERFFPKIWKQIENQNAELKTKNQELSTENTKQKGQIEGYEKALKNFSQTELGKAIGERDTLRQQLSETKAELKTWQNTCYGLQKDKIRLTARVSELKTKLDNEQKLRLEKERLLKKFTDCISTISIKVLNPGATVFLDGQNMETNQLDRHFVHPLSHRIRARYDYREKYSPFYKEYYEEVNSEKTEHWPEDQKPKIIELERKEAIINILASKWENDRWVAPPKLKVIIQQLVPLRSLDSVNMIPPITKEISGGDTLVPLLAGKYRVKGILDKKEVSVDVMVVSDIEVVTLYF